MAGPRDSAPRQGDPDRHPDRPSSGTDDPKEGLVRCIVEIPKGSRNKYERDPQAGEISLDRFLSASVVYPTDYGCVPGTLAADGDPLDALICVSEPTFPGCVVHGRVIGLFEMEDEHGPDAKLLCVPDGDPNLSSLRDLPDLPRQLADEIAHFFSIYKDLDRSRHSRVRGWRDRRAALAELRAARERLALARRTARP